MINKANKLKSYAQTIIVIIAFFILSFLTVLPYISKNGILATGESTLYINPGYSNYFTLWQSKNNLGESSPVQSNIFLFYFFWKIMKFVVPMVHPSLVFIFLATFLSSISFYFSAKHILRLNSKFILFPSSLLYAFNMFRTLGPLNERLNLLFIFLPLFFLFYYKLTHSKKWRYVFILAILSILSSSMGGNLPVFTIPYVLMVLYLLFYSLFFPKRTNLKKLILQNVVLLLFVLVGNMFWILPMFSSLLNLYKTSDGGSLIFSALGSGLFFDHFRFLGSWAWRERFYISPYYPFFERYDKFPLVFSTYSVAILSFAYLFDFKKLRNKKNELFFFFLSLISLFLLAGNKGPLIWLFKLLYTLLPIFKMYREPFMKFMPLFIFAMSFNLIFSFLYLFKKFKSFFIHNIILFLTSVLILINAYPLFSTEAAPIKFWNASQRGYLVKVPSYWKEASNFFSDVDMMGRILVFPFNSYGSQNNWEYGVNVVGNIADYVLNHRIARGWSKDKTPAGLLINEMFDLANSFDIAKYMSLFNIEYVLQENDAEFRYVDKTFSPDKSTKLLNSNKIKEVASFGTLDSDYLESLINLEPNKNLRNELLANLLNKKSLIVYELDSTYKTPEVYIAENIYYGVFNPLDLKYVVSLDDYAPKTGIFIQDKPNINTTLLDLSNKVYLGGNRKAIKLSQQDLKWDTGWTWPSVEVDPESLSYYGILVKEYLLELKEKDDSLKKADLLIWLSAKRIFEIKTFSISENYRQNIVDSYVDKMTKVFDILKKFPKEEQNDTYWGLVVKTYMYMQEGKRVLNNESVNALYDSYTSWMKAFSNLGCGNYCYEFESPNDGNYTIYIDNASVANYNSSIYEDINILSNDNNISISKTDADLRNNNKYLSSVGTLNLDKDNLYKLNLELKDDSNLLNKGEWQSYKGVNENSAGVLEFSPQDLISGYSYRNALVSGREPKIILWKEYVKFKPINDWMPYGKYEISFDYSLDTGGFGIALIEEVPDYTDKYLALKNGIVSNSSIKKIKYLTEITSKDDSRKKTCVLSGECSYSFTKTIEASKDVVSAYLYVYAFPEEGSVSNIRLSNVRVKKVVEPKIFLKNNKNSANFEIPKLKFNRINSTKYMVNLKDVENPYLLVVNNNFDKNWIVRFKGNKIATDRHYTINGYANSWLIYPEDVGGLSDYELVIEYLPQRYFYTVFAISVVLLCVSFIIILKGVFINEN